MQGSLKITLTIPLRFTLYSFSSSSDGSEGDAPLELIGREDLRDLEGPGVGVGVDPTPAVVDPSLSLLPLLVLT